MIPPDVLAQLEPMPEAFAVPLRLDAKRKAYIATLTVTPAADDSAEQVKLEFGFPASLRDHDRHAEHVRSLAWQAMELARLGRGDLLWPWRVDRYRSPDHPMRAMQLAARLAQPDGGRPDLAALKSEGRAGGGPQSPDDPPAQA